MTTKLIKEKISNLKYEPEELIRKAERTFSDLYFALQEWDKIKDKTYINEHTKILSKIEKILYEN